VSTWVGGPISHAILGSTLTTTFITKESMTLDEAVHLLKAKGCTVVKSEGRAVLIHDANDHHLWLTDDPETYSPVVTHIFADKVKPYPIDEDTRHVLGEANICADVSDMTTALGMLSEHNAEFAEIVEGSLAAEDEPQCFLWVRRRDGSLTRLDEDRLKALEKGAGVQNEIEQLLVSDPDWLAVYLEHAFDPYIVMIAEDEPLPKWDPEWLEECRRPPKIAVFARFRPEPAPRLPSGDIDYATIASYVAEDLSAIFGSNIKANLIGEAIMEDDAANNASSKQ
jgi:hypothetical protein